MIRRAASSLGPRLRVDAHEVAKRSRIVSSGFVARNVRRIGWIDLHGASSDRLRKLAARGIEARIRGGELAADGLGNLAHRHLFHVVKKEDGALVFVERRKDHGARRSTSTPAARVVAMWLLSGTVSTVRSCRRWLRRRYPAAHRRAMRVEPRSRMLDVQIREMAVRHEEDLLGLVLEIPLRDAEVAQATPHEVEVALEEGFEGHGRGRLGLQELPARC